MSEKLTKEEKHWKKYKNKRNNAILMVAYCMLFAVLGAAVLMGGLTQKGMYNALKDDEYLTDDGLPYRDMANATYTYPASEIDEMAEDGNWSIALGIIILAACAIIVLVVVCIMPEKKEIHSMLCNGNGEKEFCSECGLKLSELEKD